MKAQRYEIRVRGHLDPSWNEWFSNMALNHTDDGDTLITGMLPDQVALHGLLAKVRDLNLILISVKAMADSPPDKHSGNQQ